MKRCHGLIPIVLFLILLSANALQATEYHVTTTEEFQSALTEAQNNRQDDIIFLGAGTYNGPFAYIPDEFEDYALTIKPEPGLAASEVIIEGASGHPTLSITDPTCSSSGACGPDTAAYHIQGMTFQNGCQGINISVDKTADVIITGNVIRNNTIGGCTFAGLSCQVNTGDLTLDNNIIQNNSSGSAQPGTVYLITINGTETLKNNVIQNNTWGGVLIINDTIGSYEDPPIPVEILNNIITDNTGEFGLEADLFRASLYLINNTTCNNSGNGTNLNFILSDSVGNIYNNVVYDNEVSDFANINSPGTYFAFNNDYHSLNGSWENQGNNIDAAPKFVDASNGNYHLQSNSPCIDQGHNSAPSLPAADFEGDTRKYDGDENGSAVVDIGADEFVGPFAGCVGDFEPDGDVDGDDLADYISDSFGIDLQNFAVNFGKDDCMFFP